MSRRPPALSPSEAALTIAIPFYSKREFLFKAVESVIRQSFSNWTLVIADDGGREQGVAEWVESLGDGRVRYFRNETRLGMAGNWNRCIELAETDLVALLHADDELGENYCKIMVEAAARYLASAALFCRAWVIDAEGNRRFSFADAIKPLLSPVRDQEVVLRAPEAVEALLRGNFITCPTMCYRKSVLGSRRFSPRWKFVLDLDFYCRLLIDGESLVGLPSTGYSYRRHDTNATRRYEENLLRFREEADLYEELARESGARGWHRAVRIARSKRIIKLNLLYGLVGGLLHRRWGSVWRRMQLLLQLS